MATLYCGPTSTGAGTGADFNNRLALPDETGFVRGNVYKVIEGYYGSRTLSTAVSGATLITIQKVSSADSAVAGYSTALFDTPATFGSIIIATDNWTLDGVTRDESDPPFSWDSGSSYGFRITGGVAMSTSLSPGVCAANVTIQYSDIGGPEGSSYTGSEPNNCIYVGGFDELGSDLTVLRCYLHNIAHDAHFHLNGLDGAVIEYCWISNGWGKEAIRGQVALKNAIIRFNYFYNASMNSGEPGEGSTAEIAIWDGGANAFDNNEIYGNVFFRDNAEENSGGTIVVGGNGGSWAGSPASNTLVYNNTIAGVTGGASGAQILINGGTGNIVRNTLWYDVVGNPPSVTANTSSNNTEVVSDPFLNYATGDLMLSGDTDAGFTLSAPYNTDMVGETRGSDGTWDLGAFEYNSQAVTRNITYSGTLTVTSLTVG